MPRTRASGWSVEITHPQTDRTIRPEIASEPQFSPSLNSLPEIRIPIPKDATWLDGQFDDDPAMSVHLDGNELPIDTLVDVRDSPAGTVLVGRGGDELTDRVTVEYRTERRHTAAEDLVSNNTTYATDVVAPNSEIDEGVVFQNPDSTQEINNLVSITDTDPLVVGSGEIKMAQTGFTAITSDFNTVSANLVEDDTSEDWESDDYYTLDSNNEFLSFGFTPQYNVPAEAVELHYRVIGDFDGDATAGPDDEAGVLRTEIGSNTIAEGSGFTINSIAWTEFGGNYTGPDLQAGTGYTARIEIDDDDLVSSSTIKVDVGAVVDGRYSYNFANSTGQTGHLAGPENYPPSVTVTPQFEISAFQTVAADASLTIDDTTNNQRLQVTNDFGESWHPTDGTEDNTDSVSVEFGGHGTAVGLRFDLSRYGEQFETPTEGNLTQIVDGWELTADLRLESSLVDERFDDSIASVLTEITGSQFAWSYRIDGGSPTVAFVAYEQREASDDPDLSDVSVQKQVETWDEVVINGSNVGVSAEEFQASVTFEPLTESNILPGSETVYDSSGTQFSRGVDYEMDYSDGQIRRIGGGALVAGNTYSVDYRFQVQGTHTVSTPVSRTLTETIPGVTSSRQAEQIGFVLGEVEPKVSTPRFEGDIVIPRVDATFDPLEALQLSEFDLPDAARPLAPRPKPKITPEGVRFRVGSGPEWSGQLEDIRGTVQAVSRRS